MAGTIPMISPGVRVNEIDESQYMSLPSLPSVLFGVVGGAQFGPINKPTLLTSVSQFEQTFGIPLDKAGLTAVLTLSAGGSIFYNRFANSDAKAMSATIGTNNDTLIIKGAHKGTLMDGDWIAIVDSDLPPEVEILNVSGENITVDGTNKTFTLANTNISQGTLTIVDTNTDEIFTDNGSGDLLDSSLEIVGLINYLTGSITFSDAPENNLKASYVYTVTTASKKFKLEILNKQGNNDPQTIVEEVELSLDPEDENYYPAWNNVYFTITSGSSNDPTTIESGTYNFDEGDNGIDLVSMANNTQAINKAIEVFNDRESFDLTYVTCPEYSTVMPVGLALLSLGNSRKDCVVQIDHSALLESAEEVKNALAPFTGPAQTYVGLWAGIETYVKNPYNNDAEELVPPSVYVVPAIAGLYSRSPLWIAPAGSSNLQLITISHQNHSWTQAERDLLYAANINPILNYKGLGMTALGQKTGQTKKSATDRLNVRQLVNYCKVAIEKASIDFLFAPIDEETFSSWTFRVNGILNTIKNRRGLYDYSIKMDWETVTPDALNNNLMPGIVKIKPTKVAEFIDVDLVIKNYSDSL